MRYITVLGSTGSIGVQTLAVADAMKDVAVECLTTNTSIGLLEEQIRKYRPHTVCVADAQKAQELKVKIADTDTRVIAGVHGMAEAAAMPKSDTVITGIVGIAGLEPTLAAIRAGKRIGLANKETLVTAGGLVMELARENQVQIVPVDSEHSAVFQCLQGIQSREQEVKRIILTASGGPFFGKTRSELSGVTKSQALCHPNWEMGAKITVDCATMMNKGLEVMEAAHLFGLSFDQVSVLVHRQSIVHSMVEFVDNAVLAQLGAPDMRLPIQYALTYPQRVEMYGNELDLLSCGSLTFDEPDLETFRCLALAYRAGGVGGTMPAVLNGANEAAVELFLRDQIHFLDIAELVEGAMEAHHVKQNPVIADILEADCWAREYVLANLHRIGNRN